MKFVLTIGCLMVLCGLTYGQLSQQHVVKKSEKDMSWTCPKCGKTLNYPYSHTCE